MASLFAPPELLCLYACAEDGSGADLRKGTHLRLFPGIGAAFPLTPFVAFKLTASASEPRGLHVTDRRNALSPQGLDLSTLGVANVTPLLGDSHQRRTVRLELRPDRPDGIKQAVLLDQNARIVMERQKARWLFSSPVLHQFRLYGNAQSVGLTTSVVDLNQLLHGSLIPAAVFGLPIEGAHRWYVGGQSRTQALTRVGAGAPLRLNVMDRPDGPFDATDTTAEVSRVEALLGATTLGGGLESILQHLVDDNDNPPWSQFETQELRPVGTDQLQTVSTPRAATVQFAALDPGLARFFGFATRIEDLPDVDGAGWNTLAVGAILAMPPPAVLTRQAAVVGEDALIEQMVGAIRQLEGRDIRTDLDRAIANARAQGFQIRPMVALSAPTPPWDPPTLSPPDILDLKWQPPVGEQPSAYYRAGFAFSSTSLLTLAAVAADLGGEWKSRHTMLAVSGGQPAERAQPRMFGQESRPSNRRFISGIATFQTSSLLAETELPAEIADLRYRVRASDVFGRFGAAVEFSVSPPPRPQPPSPVLRHRFERTAIDLDSADAQVPGVVKVLFDPSAVPSISDLAAGSLPLNTLELSLLGPPQLVDVMVPGVREITFAVGALLPQQLGHWQLTGIFHDAGGTPSEPTIVEISARDVRAPKPYPTGIGLFWTSTPGPSPEVELRLKWSAPKDSQHRVYLADEHALGLTQLDLQNPYLGRDGQHTAPSRGRVAAAGCRKVLERQAIRREKFRLLTDPPIVAGADRIAVLETTLPRSLQSVQFLRIVPLGPDGAEPVFADCGIVPIAVPDARRPSPPRLTAERDDNHPAVNLSVVAEGFDCQALERDEPGLFTAGRPGTAPPRFRIRRAVGAVPDPLYARTLFEGDLTIDPTLSVFVGRYYDDGAGAGLQPFVRYVYWAEVRLPAERRLPAEIIPFNPPGGVTPTDPAGSADSPRPVSLPSAPRTVVLTADPPDALAENAVTILHAPMIGGDSEVTITLAHPQRAHPLAIDRYRLAIWTQWIDGEVSYDIEGTNNPNGGVQQGPWLSIENGPLKIKVKRPGSLSASAILKVRLAIVDPAGQRSEIKLFDAMSS